MLEIRGLNFDLDLITYYIYVNISNSMMFVVDDIFASINFIHLL